TRFSRDWSSDVCFPICHLTAEAAVDDRCTVRLLINIPEGPQVPISTPTGLVERLTEPDDRTDTECLSEALSVATNERNAPTHSRSEERRVGKEWRSRVA